MINPALSRGPLGRTLSSRRAGHDEQRPGHEPELRIEHRQALIYTLSKAAELEHLIICQYLFAAFSLKRDSSEGLSEPMVPMVNGWARTLMHIAAQEMLHLALVQNLLTAVGASPHLSRPNFPVPPRAFSGTDRDRAAAVRGGGLAPLCLPRASRRRPGHPGRGDVRLA